jgi:histidine triad (HIT) family protein
MDTDCIFCSIVNGDTDTRFVYEDERVVVFKDINPHAPVHDLIVPRRHIRSVNDLTDDEAAIALHMVLTRKEVARRRSVDASGYKLVFNVEWGGGQRIFHLHLHLLGGWEKK